VRWRLAERAMERAERRTWLEEAELLLEALNRSGSRSDGLR
jgi:hypothetical protein